MENEEKKPEYTFDIESIEKTTQVKEWMQQGNYLLGTTTNGVTFRYRIPQGKILDKVNGQWVLRYTEIL